jgi:sugar porter (SP) family MFS transporter
MSAAMGSSMFGYDSAFIGGTLSLPSFRSLFGLADASSATRAALSSHIVSTFQGGCFFGVIICYLIVETLGARWTLMMCGAIFDIGTILQVSSSGQLGLIYGGRVLTGKYPQMIQKGGTSTDKHIGLAVGASSLIVPAYISECSPPAIRGRLIGIFEIVLQFSQIIGFWVNYGVNNHISPTSNVQWRIPFALQFIPGSLLVIAMFFQPESPRWLAKKSKWSEARGVLSYLRQLPESDSYINWKVEAIKNQIEHENSGTGRSFLSKLREILTTNVKKRLLIGMALMMIQNLSGSNALNYYSPSIFQSIGFVGTNVSLLATGIFGIVKASMTTIFMLFLVDRVGRRPALLVGSTGALVAMYYLGAYSKLSGSFSESGATRDAGAYVAIVMIYIFAVFYAVSWNGIPWIFW